jgi:hypothetical protein
MHLTNHFGVTRYNGEDILFYTQGGTFAASAWIKGDEEYQQVLGRRFEAFTADDGKEYGLNRNDIRRVKDQDELNSLWAKACDAFKFAIEISQFKAGGISNDLTKYRILDMGYEKAKEALQVGTYEEALEAAKQYINPNYIQQHA